MSLHTWISACLLAPRSSLESLGVLTSGRIMSEILGINVIESLGESLVNRALALKPPRDNLQYGSPTLSLVTRSHYRWCSSHMVDAYM